MTKTAKYNKYIEAIRRSVCYGKEHMMTRFDVVAYLSGYDSKITAEMAHDIAMELYLNDEIYA